MADEPVIGGEQKPVEGEAQKLYEWTHQVPAELIDEDMHGKQKIADYVKLSRQRREELKTNQERLKVALFKPGENAKPEEIAAWNKAIGVPAKPDEYEFGDVNILDEEGAKEFKAAAHKLGLSVEQAKGIAQFEAARNRLAQERLTESIAKARETTVANIKQSYPADWEAKIRQANQTAGQFFGEAGMAKISETGLGDQEWFVRGMIELSKHFTEGGIPRSTGSPPITGDAISLDERYPSMTKFKA